ncbi:hypothetical protein [Anaerobiospirillum succiniciproducens]|uniref:hypothetical protein n=1 Tax=Anaerobiospirillum succiniciproducens TaxID=13335 RepID=UPI0023536E88|nr:hypothetical protein [Anaerobiospirillum succiniciproducens]MCI6863366.1 hypothetical protein [Anaerobiospirillum succiniciproducens]
MQSVLHLQIARKYKIAKGKSETELSFIYRNIYTVCALMGYASLLDEVNDDKVSIVHVKSRIKNVLNAYIEIYPDLSELFKDHRIKFEDFIVDLMIKTSTIYHSPYHVAKSMLKTAAVGNILFQRGIDPEDIDCISGVGFYSINHNEKSSSLESLKELYGIENIDLETKLQQVISMAHWSALNEHGPELEYLNLSPCKGQKYWISHLDKNTNILLARTIEQGSREYYLYQKNNDNSPEISRLAPWMMQDGSVTKLARALLKKHGTLPPISYEFDGDVVKVEIGYMLPNTEANMLMLYSWPSVPNRINNQFLRIMNKDIFLIFKELLSSQGYTFQELFDNKKAAKI